MPTQKEKIAVQIIFDEYKKTRNSEKIYMHTEELVCRSSGALTLSDLHGLILHGSSKYVGFHGAADSMVKILPEGISYMEGAQSRIIGAFAFWIFGFSSVIAAIFAVLDYYK